VTRRERRLGPVRRALLAGEILVAYVRVRLTLRRRTLPETVAALRGSAPPATSADEAALALGRHLAWATFGRSACSPPTRVASWARSCLRGCSRVGGSPRRSSSAPGPQFEAHAWVEHAGEPLLVPAGADHSQLVRL
jgi:hypothetical protein